jgi:PAS domain S-box-containing protein
MSGPAWSEADRLAALRRYDILDTPPEHQFNDAVMLVKAICRVPIALVSLVDCDRQWFKAAVGVSARETALDTSVCALAIQQDELFVIENLATDPRTAQMSLVTGDPHIRFYAGMPLVTSEGLPLGSLCAIDIVPRPHGLSAEQTLALKALGRQVVAQIELRSAHADRDRALWETSPDLLVILGFDGTIHRVNRAWTDLLGYAPDEMLGRHINDFVLPADIIKTQKALEDAAVGTLPIVENRYQHKDGSFRWFSWVAAPSESEIYATGRHITADKEAQAALQRAEDQLRQAQKVEAVGQLTGGVAHDFNNLLTVIRGSVDLLRRPGLSDERRARYIDAIADTTERATKLTSQLLAFARRSALKPKVFDTGASILALWDMIGTLSGSMVHISVALPETACFIRADPSQFDTALVNMAVNARDAMEGKGELILAVRPVSAIPALRAHPRVEGAFVAISIRDTGSGIDPDKIDHIFEPFFTTKGVGEGTGLGLSQVFGFAKQSGGEIQVESNAEGTVFTLFLPRVDSVADAPEVRGDAPMRGRGHRVLIVEDNADVGSFATHALGELGYATILAVDAEVALARLAEQADSIDVVFSDVVMPGMTGIELGHVIRERYPDMPLVLTSGYSNVLSEEGTHGFELLHKPYSIEQLSRVLQAALV